jgi:hypothetical protein
MRYGDGDGRVCAQPICGPYSSKLGHESVIRCARYCAINKDKENINDEEVASNKVGRNNKGKQTSKPTNRTAEYSAKELKLISKL